MSYAQFATLVYLHMRPKYSTPDGNTVDGHGIFDVPWLLLPIAFIEEDCMEIMYADLVESNGRKNAMPPGI
jgi:hypothetical protein